MTRSERVEVWVDGVGLWHWRYVDDRDDQPLVLEGNEAEEREDAATGNARTAYPGVPIVQITDPGWQPGPLGKRLSGAAAALLLLARGRPHRRRHQDGG